MIPSKPSSRAAHVVESRSLVDESAALRQEQFLVAFDYTPRAGHHREN